MPDSSTARAVRRLPFGDFRAFTNLFATYCTDYAAVADFYDGDFRDPAARKAAAERAAAHERDRDALADVLLDQNEAWGLDEKTRAHIEALRDPEGVAVVTGQQVGLLTGPLYTPLKTLTALMLTEQMREETGRPVAPVFWLEGEDHDFDEIAATQVLRRNEVVRLRYNAPEAAEGRNPGAVGQLVLTDGIEDVLNGLDEALPPSDFKPGLMDEVHAAYAPGAKLIDAFARLVRSLFPEAGLVFMNPNDARLKELTAPLFRREIEDADGVAERLQEVSARLEEDYHAQVRARPTNLFLLNEEGRHPLDKDGDRFELRGAGQSFSKEELLERLDKTPEQFSPNVILRPLMQDHLLPTAAYVAGPGEIAYFAQYKPAYDWAGLPMPVIYPRASVTLAESKVQKVLDKFEMDVPDLEGDVDALFQQVVEGQMEDEVEAAFGEATKRVHQAINDLKPLVEDVDRTLGSTAEATRSALAQELGDLKSRVIKAEKRSQDEVRAQLEKAQANLFPDGKLQERAVNVLYFLNKYSPALLDDLRATLSLDTTAHQVVEL